MKKCIIFLCRILHFVLRHIAQLDNRIEARIQAAAVKQLCCTEELPCARESRDPFFAPIRIITHAGGGLQGQNYLNCAEAPGYYYAQGNRVFEFDVTMALDGRFVLSHDDVNITEEEFLDRKLDRRFTPMALGDALAFLEEHEDVTAIFDCKCGDLGAFARHLYKNTGKAARARIVIQVFCEQDIAAIKSVFDFKLLYVCMYNADYQQVARHCLDHGVGAVSIAYKALRERTGWDVFARKNLCVFAYTVNTLDQYDWVRAQGLTGVFSDFLLETDVGK